MQNIFKRINDCSLEVRISFTTGRLATAMKNGDIALARKLDSYRASLIGKRSQQQIERMENRFHG